MNGGAPARAPRLGAGAARLALYAMALALFAGAVAVVIRSGAEVVPALEALSAAPPHRIALVCVLPLVSLVLTASTFRVLTARHAPIGRREMLALIGAAWLLNYLPLWPGMMGRLAYHKAVNGIPLHKSAAAVIWANLLSVAAAVSLTGVVAVAALMIGAGDGAVLAAAAALPALAGGAALYAHRNPPAPDPHLWRLAAALALRLVETLVWSARYALCFSLIGQPIGWPAALAVACATQIATLIPIAGNGLGLREWIVGLIVPALPAAIMLGAAPTLRHGLTADLLNRAVEVALAVPVGLVCAAWVARRLRARRAEAVT